MKVKKRIVFIDRDGTLIKEPPGDFQVDALEKLEFIPGVFRNLYRLRQLPEFELVVVSNQDGLGTERFPEEQFRIPHEAFLRAFRNEGIRFDAVHIDPSLPKEGSPNRKPGTGMLKAYMEGGYDLERSYVIGDRLTDMKLAMNLGAQGILLTDEIKWKEIEKEGLDSCVALVAPDWDRVTGYIRSDLRRGKVSRETNETKVTVEISLDGEGNTRIDTGLGFFDHMLEQLGKHGGLDLNIQTRGDLHVDEHHTVEDTAIALGEAFRMALGDKRGIERYAFHLPMDDALAAVSLDLGGRSWIEWEAEFRREKIGDVPTELFYHFFRSFADAAACNLNIRATGTNEHHKIEAIFKGFARTIRGAVRMDPDDWKLPTTKGKI